MAMFYCLCNSLGCPRIRCLDQADLELRVASASRVLGMLGSKACYHTVTVYDILTLQK